MDNNEEITDDFKILHEPLNDISEEIRKYPIIKSFFESLKSTFASFWCLEDKTHWMKLIKIKLPTTHYVFNSTLNNCRLFCRSINR